MAAGHSCQHKLRQPHTTHAIVPLTELPVGQPTHLASASHTLTFALLPSRMSALMISLRPDSASQLLLM